LKNANQSKDHLCRGLSAKLSQAVFFLCSGYLSPDKVKKTYPYQDVMPPYEKFKSLAAVQPYLRPGVTIKKLDDIANQIRDNELKDSLKKRNPILTSPCSFFD
jgi:hypothetical protein